MSMLPELPRRFRVGERANSGGDFRDKLEVAEAESSCVPVPAENGLSNDLSPDRLNVLFHEDEPRDVEPEPVVGVGDGGTR